MKNKETATHSEGTTWTQGHITVYQSQSYDESTIWQVE
jgi:hypothetical protein